MVWIRPITRRCCDCGCVLKNRSKKTRRCMQCHVIHKKKISVGRETGFCTACGKKLSAKINKTGMCESCFTFVPWNKGVTGLVPWNKGKSVFESPEEYRKHANEVRRKTRGNNLREKMADRIRTLIRNSLKLAHTRKANTKTTDLLGCSIDLFIQHISLQFEPSMNWENYGNGYGKWNIDHRIPVSSFDLMDIDEQKKAFHYMNCQPMWAIDNIKKGAKMPAAAVLTAAVTY